ncbi:sigma-70 family RNA polymerase sigma factor [uncultured Duncaniella sp.]|uniref:sigma-70 family RNA polymerase sigma factor n=2 Tax=uncultured Duncaniella sp. TaxID=2768039 RepID=UPI00259D007E|nr:sigma-70 family RNA polymerase sigma factor [uncultured Duncaniella sp.]
MLDYQTIYEEFIKGHIRPLYTYMYPGLIRYASRMLGDRLAYMAEDVVQDSVLSTYMCRNRLETMNRWRSWLLVSIHNRAIEVVRKAESGNIYTEELSAMNKDLSESDIHRALIEQEVLDSIYAVVNSLPEKYRDIFRMSFDEGLRTREIAERLNIAEVTVKKRKARLIEILRARLDGKMYVLFQLLFLF